MKKYKVALLALLVCGAGYAAQDTSLTQAEVRDPRRLETYLESNASDAQTRIAALEAGTIGGNLNVTGSITGNTLKVTGSAVIGNGLTVNTNATIGGTLAVTGVGTFTAESVHNGGIDTDYVTTDAGFGVDTKTGGALKLGEAMATSVEIAKSGAETDIQGTLSVDEAATFESTITAKSTINGTYTVGATNIRAGTLDGSVQASATNLVGTAPVSSGGSGAATLTDHSVLVGSGTAAVTPITVGTADQVLLGANTADPVFTTLTGDVTVSGGATVIGAGTVHASMIDAAIVTNVLAGGMVLPAVDGSAVTNIAGGNIASGNIAAARISNALGTSGANIGGNIPLACLTNALNVTLWSGAITNKSTLITNLITVVNGVIVSVTVTE